MEELKDNGGGLLKWLLDILVGNNGHIHDTIYIYVFMFFAYFFDFLFWRVCMFNIFFLGCFLPWIFFRFCSFFSPRILTLEKKQTHPGSYQHAIAFW